MLPVLILFLVPVGGGIPAGVLLAERTGLAHYGGRAAGPSTLVMIAFGVDPMTGRAAAMAKGHGFVAGWAVAIAGDMLYYVVVAITTLRLNVYVKNPNTAMFIVLGGMIVVPLAVRRARGPFAPGG